MRMDGGAGDTGQQACVFEYNLFYQSKGESEWFPEENLINESTELIASYWQNRFTQEYVKIEEDEKFQDDQQSAKTDNVELERCVYCNLRFPLETFFIHRSNCAKKSPTDIVEEKLDICYDEFGVPSFVVLSEDVHMEKCAYCNKSFPLETFFKHRKNCEGILSNLTEEVDVGTPNDDDLALPSFVLPNSAKSHLKEQTNVHTDEKNKKKYECEICNKSFKQNSTLKTHRKIHSDVKNYQCKVCGKKFKYDNNLKTHMKVHSEERNYECEICWGKFKHDYSLKRHMKLHSAIENYPCSICDEKFMQDIDLQDHMNMHTFEKNNGCNVCGKMFKTLANLKAHQKIHTEELNFPCTVCGRKFKQNYYLTSHMKVHSETRKYDCPVCNAKFRHGNSLKRHVRTHSKGSNYECDVCGEGFKYKYNLKAHVDEKHAVNEEVEGADHVDEDVAIEQRNDEKGGINAGDFVERYELIKEEQIEDKYIIHEVDVAQC